MTPVDLAEVEDEPVTWWHLFTFRALGGIAATLIEDSPVTPDEVIAKVASGAYGDSVTYVASWCYPPTDDEKDDAMDLLRAAGPLVEGDPTPTVSGSGTVNP